MATITSAVRGALRSKAKDLNLKEYRLQGKVALITGGASGIGKETAKTFVAHGARVILADIHDAAGENLAQDLGGPDIARYIHCDVSQEDHVAAAVDFSLSAYGDLDVMYNNAGILGQVSPIDKTSMEAFDKTYSVLLKGAFMGVKHAARVMKPLQKGSIITTASVAAHMGGVGPHSYTIFKHALLGMTRSAAYELRDSGIRVNNISPGFINTPIWNVFPKAIVEPLIAPSINNKSQTAVAHVMTVPENISSAALFLASDDSAFVSGHTLVVDGSHILNPHSHLDDFTIKGKGIRN